MENTRTANVMRTQKLAALTAALVVSALSLSACGGSGSGSNDYVRQENGKLMTMTVDGKDVTHTVTKCDGSVDDSRSSAGEIDDDLVNWTKSYEDFDSGDGTFNVQNKIDVTDKTVVIPYSFGDQHASESRELIYRLKDSEQGTSIIDEAKAKCDG